LPLEALPERYELTLAPHLDAGTFDGSARITLGLARPTAQVTLNAIELEITRAAVADNVARVHVELAAQTVTLTFARPLAAGKAVLELAWRGKLSSELRGFYHAEADGQRYAFTDFEPTEARRAFPCFDEPAVKARFQMTAVIDAAHVAVSNGPIVREQLDREHGRKTVVFGETPPLSTYLVALAVGPLVEVHTQAGRVPLAVYTTPGKAALGRYALAEAAHLMPFFERYFGIPYPYGKLDLVAVPDFEAGAMENAGAIFFRETTLLADEHAAVDQQRRVTVTVAHEMAHQWFGDLVTMKWWDDLWLNESFATWAENRATAAVHPSWEPWLEFRGWREEALRSDALTATHPIRAPVTSPEDAHEAFDNITYAKGAAVLRMLERWLGEETFRRGVDDYLRAHREGNATGDDLWRALAAASGRPVADVATSWLDRPGHPLVTATASCVHGKTELALTQERDGRSASTSAPWLIPLCARTPEGTRCALMTTARETRVVADRCEPWALANAGEAGFFRVGYGGGGLAALDRVAESALTPEERAALADDAWALADDGKLPLTAYLELVEALKGEPRRDVIDGVRQALTRVGDELVDDGDRDAWRGYLADVFGPTAEALGWETRPDDGEEQRRLRAAVLQLLGEARVPAVLQAAAARIERYLGPLSTRSTPKAQSTQSTPAATATAVTPATIDPSLVATTAALAAHVGGEARWQAYLSRMRAAPNPEERDRFLRALAHFETPALVERTLGLSLTSDVRTQDVASLLAQTLAHPWSRRAAWTFVRARFPELRARVPEFMMARIVGGTSHFCDGDLVAEAQRFFRAQKLPGAGRRLAQALEDGQACVALKQRERVHLADWLRARTRHASARP
jgi:aminopeptidase N